MLFFNNKKKLVNTGVFNAATDWHSHILPGVDDGIETMQDFLAGGYGKPAQEKACALLAKGYYSFFGSDLHVLDHFQQAINAKALKKEVVEQLPRIQNKIF